MLCASLALGFDWNTSPDALWALNCDFKNIPGRNIGFEAVQGEQCSGACARKSGCTHFVWTPEEGGRCYFRRWGPPSQSAAIYNPTPGLVCGILLKAIPPPPRASDDWPLILDVGFTSFDTNRWNYETVDFGDGWGNGEIQKYTTRNARIRNGKLRIILRKSRAGTTWLSSRINTKGKFEFTFGRIDARVKAKRVDGVFPAVWALSSKCKWPLCGEIDLFEMQTAWDYIPASLHFQSNHAENAISFPDRDINVEKWHIYSMEWTPTYIAFFHDDREIGRYNKPAQATQQNWPFTADNPFYLIVNNAMQPRGWGSVPSPELKQHLLLVDYIKVWSYPDRR